MIRVLICLLISFYPVHSWAQQNTKREYLEVAVQRAVESSEVTDSLYRRMKTKPSENPLEMAYMGVVETLVAKHSSNPFTKFQYAKSGIKKLDKAAELCPEHPKIRLLRFNIQHQIPAFLGLSKDIMADKNFLFGYLMRNKADFSINEDLGEIAGVLLSSGRCTPGELKKIRNLYE